MINDIQAKMGKLFADRKLELYTVSLNIADMVSWAERIASRQNLDKHEFESAVTELFWAIASIQLNIGYLLISLEECSLPNGKKGMVLKQEEIPSVCLADLHYWHHLYNCYESIYRFWERCVTVLKMRLTPKLKEKYYFDGYVDCLMSCEELSTVKEITKLKKYRKAWGKISWRRNESSHGTTNPFLKTNIDVEISKLTDSLGKPITKYEYELPNLGQELETIINHYKKSHDLLGTIKTICEIETEPNNQLHGDQG